MHCGKVEHKIDRYLRDELPGEAADEIEAHLDGCPNCRGALEDARELEDMFGRASTPPVPDGFASDLRERAAEREETIIGPLPAWRSLSTPWRAAVAAGLVVGLALGIMMGAGPEQSDRAEARKVARAPGVDYMSSAHEGSINRAFVSMVSGPQGEE